MLLLFFCYGASGQNETNKWYFGYGGALDFMTTPPTVLANNSMTVDEGCASIADANGDLLFYTDGMTLWTSTHTIMPNGTGLNGGHSSTQAALILKKPGSSSIYYVFTVIGNTWFQGLNYTEVDMSLASGQGSVTAKNINLFSGSLYEKLTATRHCNGTDFWILVRDYSASNMSNNGNFYAYELTSAGMNTTAVISTFSYSTNFHFIGGMKISPNGRKLACANYNMVMSNSTFELFDFDNSTGVVSNSLALMTSFPNNVNSFFASGYGVEFSPDGTKLYGALGNFYATTNNGNIFQWDLCSGSDSLIAASQKTLAVASGTNYFGVGTMQLASDGKIYVAHSTNAGNVEALSVINNPNAAGLACNFVYGTQTVTSYDPHWGLPNFSGHPFLEHPSPSPYTYTVGAAFGCQAVGFHATPLQNTVATCAASAYSITAYAWDFGDPLSGTNNLSFLANPTHTFSGAGTYTTQLVLYYSCSGGTDTLRQIINISGASLIINTASITCASLGTGTVNLSAGSGNYTYLWTPGGHTSSVVTGLIPGNYTISVQDTILNCIVTNSVYFAPLIPLTGTLVSSPSVACFGVGTGTAAYASLAGGSANQNYLWDNGINTYTTPFVSSLSAGNWSSTVTDALTACQIKDVFTITQPPAITVVISANSTTACAGTGLLLTGTASGGTPGYNYTWSSGATTSTNIISQNTPGTYVYALTGFDSNSCASTQTLSVQFIPNPTISVTNASICPAGSGTLSASGASSYTWSALSNSNLPPFAFVASPLITSNYTVVGSAQSCTSSAIGTIFLKQVPVLVFNSNSPVCEGDLLTFGVNTGTAYTWSGNNNFSSSAKTNSLYLASVNSGGVYNVTVTAANSCTASVSGTVVVKPLPVITLAAPVQSLCVSMQTVDLISNGTATSFTWSPGYFISSTNQSSTSVNPLVSKIYTVTGSLNGCSNKATATVVVIPPPALAISLSNSKFCLQPIGLSPNTITLTATGASAYTVSVPNTISNTGSSTSQRILSTMPPYTSPPGVFTATVQGSNGVCTVNKFVNIEVIPNPTISLTDSSPTICAGESYTYTSSGADNYYWSALTPGNYIYTHGNIAAISPTANSVFSVYGISQACYSAPKITSITVNALPLVSITPDKPYVCIGSGKELQAQGNATSFTWSPGNLLNSTSGSVIIAHPLVQTDFTVVASLNNCTQTAITTVSIMSLPSPSILANQLPYCVNTNLQMKGTGGIGYMWYGPDNYYAGGNEISFKINSVNQAGIYTLAVSDANNCIGKTTYNLKIHGLPEGYLMQDAQAACIPFCSDFIFKQNHDISASKSPVAGLDWELRLANQPGKLLATSGYTFSHCFNLAGIYSLNCTFRDSNNCVNQLNTIIKAWEKPKAEFTFSPAHPIEDYDNVLITTSDNSLKHEWFLETESNYRAFSKSSYFTKVFTDAGNYPVVLVSENEHGCRDTVIKTIKVEADFEVFVPRAFTPNNDNKNEVFIPVSRSVKEINFEVFDRWGKKIYETNRLDAGWDGTYLGNECQQGTYVWKLSITSANTSLDNRTRLLVGEVYLYR